jgi:hypothetical protein
MFYIKINGERKGGGRRGFRNFEFKSERNFSIMTGSGWN